MATNAAPSPRHRRIAHPLHTVALLVVDGFLVYRGTISAHQLRAIVNPNRIRMYSRTMLTEWLMFAFVILGVWLAGSPLATVVGERWRSLSRIFRDIGIGIAFTVVSTAIISMLGPHLPGIDPQSNIKFLLPHGAFEMTLWVALSISAGICEETLYRGYLQKQFMALTNNAAVGIILSAIAFGLAHSYQGLRGAILIGTEGAMLGALAYWCKTVRPGMISHAAKDSFAPLLMSIAKH
jgi:membrane protease YdiL (CAAX protease family)